MINPIIYTIFNRDFRIAGTKVIGLCRRTGTWKQKTVRKDNEGSYLIEN